jgi:acyl-CoA synthetase (AMP-forming)/AMP-acid ligase II/acyl carrier protein
VRQLLAGGDVLSPQHVRKFISAFPKSRLINGYGPTEGTTFTCCHTITAADLGGGPIPIGRPIANTRVYILDPQMRPAPIGEPGELCVAGDGLARGYWNRPELTAEKFVAFRHDRGGRIYKTGDLARYRHDGTIEFLGRVDQQVKLRGFRIEPGEIEAALRCHPSVSDALVTIRNSSCGDKRLVAYVVTSLAGSQATAELRDFLRTKLPDFMIPSSIQALASFPLGPNGKIDRSKLPDTESREANGKTARPEAGIESAIARAWEKVLRIDRAGVDDNFFDVGGDSLQLIQVCSELQRTLPLPISITDLFEFPTVRELSKHLCGAAANAPANGVDSRARKQREAQERRRARIKEVSA